MSYLLTTNLTYLEVKLHPKPTLLRIGVGFNVRQKGLCGRIHTAVDSYCESVRHISNVSIIYLLLYFKIKNWCH